MMRRPDDLVKVAAGSLIEIQSWCDVLRAAGIECRVVGDLATGPGTTRPDPVELWVHRADAEAAEAEMADRFHNSLDDARP